MTHFHLQTKFPGFALTISWPVLMPKVCLPIDICIDDLFCDTNTIHNLDRNDMRELLTLAAYESFFIFDEVMYRKIDGVAMGFPPVPILANALLCHFENSGSQNVPLIFYPKSLKDMLMIFLKCSFANHTSKNL